MFASHFPTEIDEENLRHKHSERELSLCVCKVGDAARWLVSPPLESKHYSPSVLVPLLSSACSFLFSLLRAATEREGNVIRKTKYLKRSG